MRIGIAVVIGKNVSLPCLSNSNDKNLILENCSDIGAPAVDTLIHSFLKAGHFVRIFTLAKKEFEIKTEQLEIFAASVYDRYPVKYLWGVFKNARNVKKLMRDKIEDLDVLHAHWTYQYAYAASFYADKMPVFCTVRDIASYIWRIESMKNKITWTFKVYMNHKVLMDDRIHFIANSPYTASVIKRKFGKELPVIPNSIKDSFVLHGEHRNPKRFRILCISSSDDKRKNIILLLYAFKMFAKGHSEALLQIVGTPFTPDGKAARRWNRMGLLDGVELVGGVNHEQLTRYIDECSVFVTPSLEETFGNTLLESIVRKVPVIGGEHSGAVPYVLHHGKAGYLCDVSRPESIADVLEHVYCNTDEAIRKANEAYDIILSEYAEDVVCNEHIKLYEKYLEI